MIIEITSLDQERDSEIAPEDAHQPQSDLIASTHGYEEPAEQQFLSQITHAYVMLPEDVSAFAEPEEQQEQAVSVFAEASLDVHVDIDETARISENPATSEK